MAKEILHFYSLDWMKVLAWLRDVASQNTFFNGHFRTCQVEFIVRCFVSIQNVYKRFDKTSK